MANRNAAADAVGGGARQISQSRRIPIPAIVHSLE
jgi:hypothetical protein